MVDIVTVVEVTIIVLTAAVGAIIFVWRFISNMATKMEVTQSTGELRDTLDSVAETAEKNREEIRDMKNLINGGGSKFDQGIVDHLEENINSVSNIEQDIREIKSEHDKLEQMDRWPAKRDDND